MANATQVSAYIEIDGPEVRRRRIAKRLKVAELAGMVKIHPNYLYNLEIGRKRRVSVGTLRDLEEHLGRLDPPAVGAERAVSASPAESS
ncbi:helix-turn-helix domain-containing protein [Parafrankia sp. FMc2]|uniref:helix-turn-helix domain-containing protein n=1 Tax=Parafrankia sp. FMc2 TaxID=3233196 RepID=UPI0034D6D2F1